MFCVYWDYAEWKIFSELDKIFFIFQISNDPLVFANNSFSKILYSNSYRDGFISQNVNIYLAYTEYKRNQVLLILRLSGIDFILYWVSAESTLAYTEYKRNWIV